MLLNYFASLSSAHADQIDSKGRDALYKRRRSCILQHRAVSIAAILSTVGFACLGNYSLAAESPPSPTVPNGMSVSDYAFQLALAEQSTESGVNSASAPQLGNNTAAPPSKMVVDKDYSARRSVVIGEDGLSEGATYIEADSLETQQDGSVKASGSVMMRNRTRIIRADEIQYNPDTSEVVATGNTQTINDDGSIQFADRITYNDQVDQGVGENIASTGKDNTKVLARRIERLDENTNRLLNVIYTPCKLCQKKGVTQSPSWSLEAEKITQRKDKKLVYYNNAILKLHGIPVFYAPYMWTPDPELDRASGFLPPRIGNTERRGFSLEQPYLWSISPYQELIISPQFNESVAPFLNFSYKRHFYSGLLNVRVGGTKEAFFDNLGNFYNDSNHLDNNAEKDWRYYILADGNFKINEKWHWSFTAQNIKDDYGNLSNSNFLDRYDVEGLDTRIGELRSDNRVLVSQFNIARIDSNAYINLSMADFQSYMIDSSTSVNLGNGTSRPVATSSDTFPVIAPMMEAYWSPKRRMLGGDLTLSLNGIAIKHKLFPALGIAPEASDGISGFDTTRVSFGASWYGHLTTKSGVKWGPFVDLRQDYYSLSSFDSSGKTVNTSRDLSTVGLNISYPLYRRSKGLTTIIEPIAQLAISPEYKANQYIGTEDSPFVDFDETKLFSINKSSGYDIYESGSRLNLGVRTELRFDNNARASFLIGRTLRSEIEPQFIRTISGTTDIYDPSGMGLKASDWIVTTDISNDSGLYGYVRSRLDSDSLRLKNGEAGLSLTHGETALTLRYIYDDVLKTPIVSGGKIIHIYGSQNIYDTYYGGDPSTAGVYRNVQIYGRHFFNENWGITARLDRDLLTDKFRRSTISLVYRDDCSWYELVYRRNDTRLNTINGKPQVSWLFRLNLATMGTSRAGMKDVR